MMKKYDDAQIDALLKKLAVKKEKLDSITKEKLYAKIDTVGIYSGKSSNGKYLRFATVALAVLCIVLSVLLFLKKSKPENISVNGGDDNRTASSSADSKVISQPTYLKAMKYEWYSAEKTKSFVYDRQSEEGRYFELTLDTEDECYSFDIENHSSSYSNSYNSKKNKGFTTDEQKKLSVYQAFYEGAMDAFVFYDDEFKKLLLEKYEEMYVFAGEYPSYLQEGIRLAIDDIKDDKRYVFVVRQVHIGDEDKGCQIFKADIKNIEFKKLENIFYGTEKYCEVEGISLFDERIRTKIKVIEWVWESTGKEKKDYSLFRTEVPQNEGIAFYDVYYAE